MLEEIYRELWRQEIPYRESFDQLLRKLPLAFAAKTNIVCATKKKRPRGKGGEGRKSAPGGKAVKAGKKALAGAAVRKFTLDDVKEALKKSNGNVILTAEALSCHSGTVYGYLRKYPELKELQQSIKQKNPAASSMKPEKKTASSEDTKKNDKVDRIVEMINRCKGDLGKAAFELKMHKKTIKLMAIREKRVRKVLEYWNIQ